MFLKRLSNHEILSVIVETATWSLLKQQRAIMIMTNIVTVQILYYVTYLGRLARGTFCSFKEQQGAAMFDSVLHSRGRDVASSNLFF